MERIVLQLSAPFSAFRIFQPGYRPVYPVIPPTAARGLFLNLAGIDTDAGNVPAIDVAVGVVKAGKIGSLLQQLHSVKQTPDASDKVRRANTHGSKYHISTVRREVCTSSVFKVAMRAPAEVVELVRAGLRGELPYFGVPFAGDNQFTYDRIDEVVDDEATWYEKSSQPKAGAVRLTTGVDFKNPKNTTSCLFSRQQGALPDSAWVTIAG